MFYGRHGSLFASLFVLAVISAGFRPAFGQEESGGDAGGGVIAQGIELNVDLVQEGEDGQGSGLAVLRIDNGTGVQTMQFSTIEPGMFSVAPTMAWASPLGGDPSSLMMDPQVRGELELVEDQVEQLERIREEFQQKFQKISNFKNGEIPQVDRLRGMSEKIKELSEEQQARIKEVLLPHQSERLEQISTQMKMKQMGTAGALSQGALAETLGIDEEQRKRLQEKSKELQEKLAQEIEKLREEMREELLEELSSEQRKQLKEMMGDKFERESTRRPRLRGRDREEDR